jgi:hypothetical protein
MRDMAEYNENMKTANDAKTFAGVLAATGAVAIVAGGMLAAFSAHHPTEPAVWASAYLVLVAGVAQMAFGAAVYLFANRDSRKPVISAFISYNICNIFVLMGTVYKHRSSYGLLAVEGGGLIIIFAILSLLYATRGAKRSWGLLAFYIIATAIAVSAPIGMILARG